MKLLIAAIYVSFPFTVNSGECCYLADDAQNVAGVDSSALGNCDGGNGARAGSEDLVLHLHGLEDEEQIAFLDGLTGGDLHIEDGAGHGAGDSAGAGGSGGLGSGSGSSGRRGSSSGSGSGSAGNGSRGSAGDGSGSHAAAGSGLDGDFVGGAVNGDIVLLDHVCSLLKIKLDFFDVHDVHAAGRDTDLFRESGSDRGHDLRLHALRLGSRRGGGSRSGGSGGRCFLFALEDRTHCHGEENDADQAKEHRANTHQGNEQAAVFHFFLLPFNLDYSKAIAQFASAYALFARF
nr:MAG TPA: hypothetical protein [Caudoviricetes sp.]